MTFGITTINSSQAAAVSAYKPVEPVGKITRKPENAVVKNTLPEDNITILKEAENYLTDKKTYPATYKAPTEILSHYTKEVKSDTKPIEQNTNDKVVNPGKFLRYLDAVNEKASLLSRINMAV